MKHYILLILLAIVSVGKAEKSAPVALYQENYQIPITIGKYPFMAEIVDTPQAMQKGMMYRPSIKTNQVMLFVFATPRLLTFWMKDMQIPLDMLFFDDSGVLQEIKTNVPICDADPCPTYPALHDNNQIVAEIKAGQAKKLGLRIGDKLRGL